MSSEATRIQFSVFDNENAARLVASSHDVPVYRQAAEADERWACVHLPDDSAASQAVQVATGSIAYRGQQQDVGSGSVLTALWFNPPLTSGESFEEWFRSEHGPLLLNEPTWLRIRQVRIDSSNMPATHLVLHDLAGMSTLSSEALTVAREAPGRVHLATQDWFVNNVTQIFEKDSCFHKR
ncbi:hypothetical protein [Saccharopolyspora sp. NPDC002376]